MSIFSKHAANERNRFTHYFLMFVLVLLAICLSMIVWPVPYTHAQETYSITIMESPAAFGTPAIQCITVTTNGSTVQDCFVKVGQICTDNTTTIGPIDEGGIDGYWFNFDRRSNCSSVIRIGAPDVACHLLIPKGGSPSLSCRER